ncbi:MAG: endonuclease/exonuclease/phosphatase family protein [Chitinispirillaceae bacterium]|nr:endonuclease/exonuclease/phosphatase family protein [Chitinispirillaceae bacterium]
MGSLYQREQLSYKRRTRSACFFIAAAALFSAFSGCSGKKGDTGVDGRIAARDTVAIAFYNVENLFDLNYDSTEYAEYRPGALGWNKQTWEKKVYNIAAAIAALDADVIGLCEVENRNALEDLRRALDKRGAAYRYAAVAGAPGRGAARAALLSRIPIAATRTFGGKRDSADYRRDVLEADIDCGGTALKLFVNHWPSKKHPASQRVAAARALAERLKALPPETDYVVMGDLNDDYDEWRKLRTEHLDDTKGRTGINHVLKTVHDESGRFVSYVTVKEMAEAEGTCHCDLWLELPEERRISYTYQGQGKTPDHILLPRALFDNAGWSYLQGSFSVFTWEGRLLRNGEPFRWQMRGFGKRRFHAGEGYSDHLPIRAVFIKKHGLPAGNGAAAPSPARKAARQTGADGFEKSMEGWLAGARGFSAARDSGRRAAGSYCLRIRGAAQEKNCCAARTVLRREATNRERRENIVFDLCGSGKISVRARAGKGRWRYYNAPFFSPSGSARYLPVRYASWRHLVLPFIYDNTSSSDLTIEIRAGKAAAFCFWVDNVAVR